MSNEQLTRLRLDIAYDGTDFAGWARQPALRTVQGELESALATVLRDDTVTLTVAGRTDAGVHATGQVAHLDLTDAHLAQLAKPHGRGAKAMEPAAALKKRLNGIAGLRSDIHVGAVSLAPDGFDARFSPLFRRYEYRVADSASARNPLLRRHTVWYPAALDVEAMNDAARELLGLHDWAAYCRPREGATTIRELQEFAWRRDETGVLIAGLKADAFCHSMVRALVGASVSVGERRLSGERLRSIRDEAQRTSEFKVMPAHGLALVEVGYPEDVAARAAQTRARREAAPAAGRDAEEPLS